MSRSHLRAHVALWAVVGPATLIVLLAAVMLRGPASPAFADDAGAPAPAAEGGGP